jgi:hypothetical protein
MLRIERILPAFILALTAAACGQSPSDEETSSTVDAVSRALVPGYYQSDSMTPDAPEMTLLMLFDHATNPQAPPGRTFWGRVCHDTPCTKADGIQGTWSASTRYLRLVDSDGALIARYAYQMYSQSIILRQTSTRHWFAMSPMSESACDSGNGGWTDDDRSDLGFNCVCPDGSHWSEDGCLDADGQPVPPAQPSSNPSTKMPLPSSPQG